MMRTIFNMLALLWCLAFADTCESPDCDDCTFYIYGAQMIDLHNNNACRRDEKRDNNKCYYQGKYTCN